MFRGIGSGEVVQYDINTAWDISDNTLDSVGQDLVPDPMNTFGALRFSGDGQSLYTLGSSNAGTLYQFTVEGSSTLSFDITGLPVYKEGGNIRSTFTEISGLEDLEGECLGIGALGVVADGDVVNQLCSTTNPNCVTDGKITLCNRASRLHIGWRYISDIETLDIETKEGTIQGKIKRIPSVTIRFKKSRLGLVGPDKFHLTKMKQRDTYYAKI